MKWFVLFLVFLVGCDSFSFGEKEPQVPKIVDTLTGNQGLVIDFVSLPATVLMCQGMDIIVEMKNFGASKADGDFIFIVEDGFLKPDGSKNGKFSIEGKTQYNPLGEIQRKSLKVKGQPLPSQLETLNTPIIFQACYPYKTFLSTQVCLDAQKEGRKDCVPRTLTFANGQGAPVAITKVEPRMLPETDGVRPAVIMSVANVGGGRIISESHVSTICSGAKASDVLKNEIAVSAKLGGEDMDCRPKMLPFDVGKEVQVMCIAKNIVKEGSFETVLTAELSYGYVSTLTRQVAINRLTGQKNCD